MKTSEIAQKLVAHCRKTEWEAAQQELYSADAVSIEPAGSPAFEKETKGLPAIIQKGKTFNSMVEVMHSNTVSDPLIAADIFTVTMVMDVTMKGRGRVTLAEVCVYTVKDGKIVSERFFY